MILIINCIAFIAQIRSLTIWPGKSTSSQNDGSDNIGIQKKKPWSNEIFDFRNRLFWIVARELSNESKLDSVVCFKGSVFFSAAGDAGSANIGRITVPF